VDSGEGKNFEFFACKQHVSRGNCKRQMPEVAIAKGKKPLTTRGSALDTNRRDFEHFMPKWSAFLNVVNLIFLIIKSKK